MVCRECRGAGQLSHHARTRDGMTGGMLEHTAKNAHLRCRGGTWCDCQHKAHGVNWQLIKGFDVKDT